MKEETKRLVLITRCPEGAWYEDLLYQFAVVKEVPDKHGYLWNNGHGYSAIYGVKEALFIPYTDALELFHIQAPRE